MRPTRPSRPGAVPSGPGASAGAGTALLERPVQVRLPAAPDTLLPGRTPDNFVPRRQADPARRRKVVVVAIVVAALALSAWTAAKVVFTSDNGSPVTNAVRDRRAEGLLRDAADAARTVFMQEGTFAHITPAQVEDRALDIPIVAAGTVARSGRVSIRSPDDDTLILASPGAGKTCVFARDEPTASQILFAATRGKPCAATAAPRSGWTSG